MKAIYKEYSHYQYPINTKTEVRVYTKYHIVNDLKELISSLSRKEYQSVSKSIKTKNTNMLQSFAKFNTCHLMRINNNYIYSILRNQIHYTCIKRELHTYS